MAAPADACEDWTRVLERVLGHRADVQKALLGYTVTVAGKEYTLRNTTGPGGAYGVVYAAQDSAGAWFAVKVFLHPAEHSTTVELENAARFIRSAITNRNVVQLYAQSGRAPAAPPAEKSTPPLELPCIVCELCAEMSDGAFKRALALHGVVYMTPFSERFARHFFKEILRGLRFLHSMEICHRDLKTENVFLTADGILKLGDFGAVKHTLQNACGDGSLLFQAATVQGVGTAGYFPPEFFAARDHAAAPAGLGAPAPATYNARQVDVFSMGQILLYMVGVDVLIMPPLSAPASKRRVAMPFALEDFSLLEDAHADFTGQLHEPAPRFESFWARYSELSARLSSDCKDLINRCMVKDPLKRIALNDVAHHPFMLEPAVGNKRPRGSGAHEPPRYPTAEEVSAELKQRKIEVPAHPDLVACASAGAIGTGALQQANSLPPDASRLSDVWDERLETPTDGMFAAATHWIRVRDVPVGQKTMHAAHAFFELSELLDQVKGVVQFARSDADCKFTLRLTGVYTLPDDDDVEAPFSAQVLLPPPDQYAVGSQVVDVLLQLLPLKDAYRDSDAALAARGAAIKALADELRKLYRAKTAMRTADGAAMPA